MMYFINEKKLMKKLIYFILTLIVLLTVGNFVLRYLHIKEIKRAINTIESKLADSEITLEINQPTFDGWFFWNISGLTRNVEIYTTITQSVLYFKIPEIFIQSNFIGFDTLLTEVFFTENLDGYASINNHLAEKLNIKTDYKIFLETPKRFLINALKKDLWKANHETEIDFQSEDFNCNIQEKHSDLKEKVFDVKNIMIKAKIFDSNKKHWEYYGAFKDLNIYLSLENAKQYLPKTISINDASKNIFIETNISKSMQTKEKLNVSEYEGNIDIINRVFSFCVDGINIREKNKSGNEFNKANLNFTIKHFQNFMDYIVSIILSIKKQNNPNYETKEFFEIRDIFQNIILENSIHKDDDVITFNIKDVEELTLFNGQKIDQVFSKFINKAKSM